jgi:hypothetical protein
MVLPLGVESADEARSDTERGHRGRWGGGEKVRTDIEYHISDDLQFSIRRLEVSAIDGHGNIMP